jgi:starch phosphorylase
MIDEANRLRLPKRIGRLDELAHNLWWSWHSQARDLFRILDYPLWRNNGHNPVKLLRDIDPDKLKTAARDPAFLTLYDFVMTAFDADMAARDTWFATKYPNAIPGPIACFSMEFAFHSSLPIYAGGLGILAGDTCKEASDLGLPLVGVGFMYPQGYFLQSISADGWQNEIYRHLNFSESPIAPVISPQGSRTIARVELDDKSLFIGVWKVQVGRVNIYLLDTNVEENSPNDRLLSARLYIADKELRIQQEMVLGIGGVRVLRALGINPVVWHANEGHTAFMILELIKEEVEKGASFDEALEKTKAKTVFTTHTPVPAGHDVFPVQLVEKCFHKYWGLLGIDADRFIKLGQRNGICCQTFNMAALALTLAGRCNAVSKLHATVARKVWHSLWPGVEEDKVPISHVTNGIHVPTWACPSMAHLYEKYLGQDWLDKHDDRKLWKQVMDIPDEELWAARQVAKRNLTVTIQDRARRRWDNVEVAPQQVLAMGALLDPWVLTIGFVRRFAEYKRPALIFQDIERLKRIVNNKGQPVQIVFAGKSHPADYPSKCLLQRVYNLAADREFQGRIAFVEDYDMHTARYLVQGVDLWLNNPRRLNEACGTSGMKAALNGVPSISVLDGWWQEGYNGNNGWAIGAGPEAARMEDEDKTDAEALYQLIEKEIVPLYYERDRDGVPHGWLRVVKETIRSIVPQFCARRMVKEYTERIYLPATAPIKR